MGALTIRRGDDELIAGELMTRTGEPLDITGWTLWFTVKRRWPDNDAAAVVKKTNGPDLEITEPERGEFEIRIRAADFASLPNAERTVLHYDVQAKRIPDHKIQTLGDGDFVVLGDTTWSVS